MKEKEKAGRQSGTGEGQVRLACRILDRLRAEELLSLQEYRACLRAVKEVKKS